MSAGFPYLQDDSSPIQLLYYSWKQATGITIMEPADEMSAGSTYEIRFQGTLEVELSAWLGGHSQVSEVRDSGSSMTCLIVRVPDQAALRGVLNRLWDLNLTLTSVRRIAGAPDKENDHEC